MPKPGKTTRSFTKYHLFFCLQKRFFTINWTYRAFPPHSGNFHSPFPDTPNQIQFKMKAMLVVTRKWPRWALMPSRSEAVSRGRIDTQGKTMPVFFSSIFLSTLMMWSKSFSGNEACKHAKQVTVVNSLLWFYKHAFSVLEGEECALTRLEKMKLSDGSQHSQGKQLHACCCWWFLNSTSSSPPENTALGASSSSSNLFRRKL